MADGNQSASYVCVQRGPDSKVWQQTVLQTNQAGVVRTNQQSYSEIATGLCYLQNGQYVDSVEQVDPIANGAQAVQGQHQVWWAANANTPNGAVVLTTPDGKLLSSTVFGLAYYDTATGSNAAIAYLQNSTGSIVAPNQVLYPNAFSNLNAGIEYTYTKAGLSQDILLDQAPPAPDRYGLADDTTTLQIYTQFFNPPEPGFTTVTNGNFVDDQILDFGAMKMGIGEALFLNGQDAPVIAGLVSKQWAQINGNTFLIESIPYAAISNQLQQLPQASNLKPGKGSIWRTAFLDSKPHLPVTPAASPKPMKQAKVDFASRRVVLDYNLSGSSNNCTLQGDTTYYVSGTFNVTGVLTIEGGAVVKYTNSGTSGEIEATNFDCQTAAYRPAVFTSMDDNSVGSPIGTNPPSRTPGLYLNFQSLDHFIMLRNLRFSYANSAIIGNLSGTNSLAIWDCQFVNCNVALSGSAVQANSSLRSPIYVYNSLFSQCATVLGISDVLIGGSAGGAAFNVINATADRVGTFAGSGTNNTCYVTNTIFTTVTNLSGITSSASCSTNSSGTGVYQTVGAGSYYLANGSTNQAAGTTNIDPALLTDLKAKTTWPPTNLSGLVTNNYTFSPTAQRDTNGLMVDRGYHYDPIDYGLSIKMSNAMATVQPGTALASFGSVYGVWMSSGGTFNCRGTAASPCHFVRYNTVQEQSNTNCEESVSWTASFYPVPGDASSPSVLFRFTDWSALAQDNQLFISPQSGAPYSEPLNFQDCQIYNGSVSCFATTLSCTNSLFQRVNLALEDDSEIVSNAFYNNLFWNGEFEFQHALDNGDTGIWSFRDNLFDQTAITLDDYATNDLNSNNAYVTTNFGAILPGNNDVTLTSSPAYQPGSLGSFYYPTNQTNLINRGSRSAATAGLYHYTVLTNNTIESNNTVSIGFHYVACDTNNLPLDSNGDGIPDYLEDPNGNGIIDSGETNWALAILEQPLGLGACVDSDGSFSVYADGIPPISYQWVWNETNIFEATNWILSLTNIQVTNEGSYDVVVSSSFGSLTSSVVTLGVGVSPQILSTTPLASSAINFTASTSISASVSATNPVYPVSYEWLLNGTNIPGATSSNVTLALASGQEGTLITTVSIPCSGTNISFGSFLFAQPGMAEAWGDDSHGECDRPVTVTNMAGIAAGEYQSVAVTDDGTVYQWGEYSNGASLYSVTNSSVATQPPASNVVAVAAGLGHALALLSNGTLTNWGLTNDPANFVLTNLPPVKAIACGWSHNVALGTNGMVYAWGNTNFNQTLIPTNINSNVVAIAAGGNHSLAVLTNGTVVSWGDTNFGLSTIPTNVANAVAVAAGAEHSLALTSNGIVVAWGENSNNQTSVPSSAMNSNVMAIAAGDSHSVALINDGSVVSWGDNTYGQTNTIAEGPGVSVKSIAAGGNHSLAAIWSSWVQYPIDVSKDLLLIYNSNSIDSFNVCQYYLTHRPMISSANLLGIDCTTNEQIDLQDFTNNIAEPIQNWLTGHPTKRPSYVVLFQDIPSRTYLIIGTDFFTEPSVQYLLNGGCATNWQPFVTSINMNGTEGTNDCIAYINKLAFFGSNYCSNSLILSASMDSYGDTNWYFDDTTPTSDGYPIFFSNAIAAVTNIIPAALVDYIDVRPYTVNEDLAAHITSATNVANFASWGLHGYFGDTNGGYATNGTVEFSGQSGWYIIQTCESFNGQRVNCCNQGNFLTWFAANAFNGTNSGSYTYTNTPVGGISNVEEPQVSGANNPSLYFGYWAADRIFAYTAWNSYTPFNREHSQFLQVVGDPFTSK